MNAVIIVIIGVLIENFVVNFRPTIYWQLTAVEQNISVHTFFTIYTSAISVVDRLL